jgi:hypothetical protein
MSNKFARALALGIWFFATAARAADDAPERRPETVQGIASVSIRVTDKSKPGESKAPPAALVQRQLALLLQTKCGLAIVPDNGDAEVNLEFLTMPIDERDNGSVYVAVVRTSIWREACLWDPASKQPDKSRRMRMAGWILSTTRRFQDDPTLEQALRIQVDMLSVSIHPSGRSIMPGSFSEAFFASRKSDMEQRIGTLITQKVRALPNIDPMGTTLTADLRLENGVLKYTFHGPLKFSAAGNTYDDVNAPGQVDLAAYAAIGTLPQAKITFINPRIMPTLPPQSVTLKEVIELEPTK